MGESLNIDILDAILLASWTIWLTWFLCAESAYKAFGGGDREDTVGPNVPFIFSSLVSSSRGMPLGLFRFERDIPRPRLVLEQISFSMIEGRRRPMSVVSFS